MKKYFFSLLLLLLSIVTYGQRKHSKTSAFKSYKGLVMAGYQGWFNAPEDGAGRGWNHYLSHQETNALYREMCRCLCINKISGD